jgi:hypothetical protein
LRSAREGAERLRRENEELRRQLAEKQRELDEKQHELTEQQRELTRTREVKLGCVFTQTTYDEEGFPIRDPNSTPIEQTLTPQKKNGGRDPKPGPLSTLSGGIFSATGRDSAPGRRLLPAQRRAHALPPVPPPAFVRWFRGDRSRLQNRDRESAQTVRNVLDGSRRERHHRSSLLSPQRSL